ncbi:hypothetical protein GW943_00470 [Candidatus Parcubacteria bacterium]|nr:hypothetical protein [Candidatus Parcubacteria bacterium]
MVLGIYVGITPAHAEGDDRSFSFPGSAWNSTGNLSPFERGNVISQTYAEQGVKVWSLTDSLSLIPYVSGSVTADTKGYDWNNKLVGTGGLKLQQDFANGIIALRVGYAYEYRFKSGIDRDGLVGRLEYWFGWSLDDERRFPGSSWGVVGFLSPLEKGNLVAAAYVQQGYVAYRNPDIALVPFIEATVSTDTKDYDWNNYVRGAAGVKAAVTVCSCDIGVAYAYEKRFQGSSRDGVMFFVRFWFGWNPKSGG